MSALVRIAAIAVAVSLAGCATTQTTKISTAPIVTKPKLRVKDPAPVKLKKADWIVITPRNVESVFAKAKASGKKVVFFAVTEDGLRAVRGNEAQLLRLVGQQKSVIVALKKYYDEP